MSVGSRGVTNLLHKSSLNRTWPNTPCLQKKQSVLVGYDTLSFVCPPWWGEGRGEASCRLSKLHKPTLSMAEGRGEASDWLSKFCKTSIIKPHLSMVEGRGEASIQSILFFTKALQNPYLSMAAAPTKKIKQLIFSKSLFRDVP